MSIGQEVAGSNCCSPACMAERRVIRRELAKWSKNVLYLVGKFSG